MKLIVGLGNPGRAFDGTRHNVGFDVLSILAKRAGSPVRRQRFQGEVAQVMLRGNPSLLLWPLTWMNLSGSSVLAARDFYKIDHGNILVICDDFQLALGTIRLRGSGSGGGQNGLANVLARLGATAIPRLRIGIGPVVSGWKTADFVLSKFATHEQGVVAEVLERAADAVEEWIALGLDAAMNRFN